MNIQDIINAFGHASDSDLVDDILQHFECKGRPKGDESLVMIESKKKDLSFQFSSNGTYREDVPGGPKSEGWYILRSVDVDAKYTGELPYGLKWSMTGVDVSNLLGAPLEADDIQVFHKEGIILFVRFKNEKRIKIISINFTIKDKYDAKNYGI